MLMMFSPDSATAQARRGGPATAVPQEGTPAPTRGGRGGAPTSASQPVAAWWTDAALVARLGVTDDQKSRIEAIYGRYRQTLVQNKTDLEREEAVLARMLETEPMEPVNVVSTQIERVVQARGEMERTYSKMTLEIRQILTRTQWIQLQAELQPAQPPPGQRGRGGARGGGPAAPATPPTP
jgi:Spy/CpxP family protein refolding chaperone